MRRITTALTALALSAMLMPSTAGAHDSGSIKHKNKYLRSKVINLHGERAPGRNVVKYGLKGGKTPNARQIRRYFNAMRRMVMPGPAATYVSAGRPFNPPARTRSVNAGGKLESIAACESHGSPTAVSPTGQYRGKYQFDRPTWESVGGTGDPAAAPEWEQDKRAAMLLSQRGTAPWPVCGS